MSPSLGSLLHFLQGSLLPSRDPMAPPNQICINVHVPSGSRPLHPATAQELSQRRPSAESSFLSTESWMQAEAGMPWGGWGSAGDGEGVAARQPATQGRKPGRGIHLGLTNHPGSEATQNVKLYVLWLQGCCPIWGIMGLNLECRNAVV